MAKQQDPTSEERETTVIRDSDGNEIHIGSINREFEDGDNERTESITEYIEGADGHMWGAPFVISDGQKGALVVCEACRRRAKSFFHRRHSQMIWTPVASARRCFSCGRNFCSVHYTLSRDNHVRCRRCNRWHFFAHHVLRPMFFKTTED